VQEDRLGKKKPCGFPKTHAVGTREKKRAEGSRTGRGENSFESSTLTVKSSVSNRLASSGGALKSAVPLGMSLQRTPSMVVERNRTSKLESLKRGELIEKPEQSLEAVAKPNWGCFRER